MSEKQYATHEEMMEDKFPYDGEQSSLWPLVPAESVGETKLTGLTIAPAPAVPSVTESINFWLGFPIELRPLKFVPGRNRREKRTFRALAAQAERGTISRGRKGKGGNIAKLRGLYDTLKALGMLRDSKESK